MTLRRRHLLCSALAPLAACAPQDAMRWQGGFVGASHDTGHAWRDGTWPRAQGPTTAVAVAVVGAGVAGLAAARALRRRGIDDIAVFDLEDSAGGNSRAHAMGGTACPLGAHYLPVPGPQAHEVGQWLHEIGLARAAFGRTVYDERAMCHAPQERLFVPAADGGAWQEGVLPPLTAEGVAQARRLSHEVRLLREQHAFAMPTLRAAWTPAHAALDGQTFAAWLDQRGLGDAALRWTLDYACRDDYGAGCEAVSAWAGLHYFASRHGFHAPGSDDEDAEPVLTWPQGNAWLTQRLSDGLGDRLHTGAVVTRITPGRHDVTLDVWRPARQQAHRVVAQQVVVCVPLFVAARLVDAAPAALTQVAPTLAYAPWLVSNLQLRAPLVERGLGPPLSWDNVLMGGAFGQLPASLGYVNALHQRLAQTTAAPVLTHYWAFGGRNAAERNGWRAALLREPWLAWAQRVVADLARAHPDLPGKLERIDLMRYGHAMAIPAPGVRGSAALAALAQPQGRLHFAHADLSGYSVFEEAFTRGTLAGESVAAALHAASAPHVASAPKAARSNGLSRYA
jgi:monoamine oxidase